MPAYTYARSVRDELRTLRLVYRLSTEALDDYWRRIHRVRGALAQWDHADQVILESTSDAAGSLRSPAALLMVRRQLNSGALVDHKVPMINWGGLLRYGIWFGGVFALIAGCVNAIDYQSAWFVIKLPTGVVGIIIGGRMMFRAHDEQPRFLDLTT